MKNWLKRDLIVGPFFRLALSERDYLRECKRLNIKDPDLWVGANGDATTHSFRHKGLPVSIVCLDPEKAKSSDTAQVAGILIHETMHVWQNYCLFIGERSPSSEFEAYSVQTIAQRLISSYHQQVSVKPAKKRPSSGSRASRARRRSIG